MHTVYRRTRRVHNTPTKNWKKTFLIIVIHSRIGNVTRPTWSQINYVPYASNFWIKGNTLGQAFRIIQKCQVPEKKETQALLSINVNNAYV